MATKPRASILIPIWNCAAFVEEALRSVFAQTTDDMEVLVFDDASDDGTFERADAVIRRHARGLTILNRQEVHKAAGNYHEMVGRASSDIIITAHGDDISLPGRFERLLSEFAAADDIMMVSSNAVVTDAQGFPQQLFDPERQDLDLTDLAAAQDIIGDKTTLGATLSFRRRLIDEFPLDPELYVYGDDLVLPFRAQLLGRRIFIGEPLINWRLHGANGHLRYGARADNPSHAEQHEWLLQQSLLIRAKDLETVISRVGETEPLVEARRRLAIHSARRLESWLKTRGRLLNAGYRPGWRMEPPHAAEPVRTATLPLETWVPISPGLPGATLAAGCKGWHAPDGWGIWSSGKATLGLGVPDRSEPGLWVEIEGQLPDGPAARTLSIRCAGELLWAGVFEGPAARAECLAFLPSRLAPNGRAEIEIAVSPPAIPSETIAGSEDGREIGLGNVSVRLRAAGALRLAPPEGPLPQSDVPGWFPAHHVALMVQCIEAFRPYLAVEIGSFAGRSSLVMFEALQRMGQPFRLVCIDTWETAIDDALLENVHVLDLAEQYPQSWPDYAAAARGKDSSALFAKTLADHPQFAAKVEARREDGGLTQLGPWKAGLVFIDGSHEEADVLRDFRNMLVQMLPGCTVMFHDYGGGFPGVKHAVDALCEGPGVSILAIEPDMAVIQITDPARYRVWFDDLDLSPKPS